MQKAYHARGLRFLSQVATIITISLITAIASYQAAATDVFTDPVGFITLNVISNGYNFCSLSMTRLPVQLGAIGAVSGHQLAISNSTLVANQYVPSTGTNFFIEITSGPTAGLMDDIVSNDTANVYTATDDSLNIAAGVTFKIYPHWTPDTAFGPPSQSGLNGAATQSAADNVLVWNPFASPQANVTYYWRTAGTPGWRTVSQGLTVPAGTNVLYIDQGFAILRRPGAPSTNFLVVGGVKLGPTASVIVSNGYTYAANVYPASITMDETGLFTTNSATGLLGAATQAAADNVLVWNPYASPQANVTYYWRTAGTPGWRTVSQGLTVPAGTNVISLGSMLKVLRRAGNPMFTWVAPQPFVQ
jgi:uncharacterized protein (TIGR02597 family)